MYPRQSSRIRRGSKEEFQGSPSPNEPIHHKWMKKKKSALRKTKVDDSGANTDDERDCEILDMDSTQQKHLKKDEGWFARVDDEGVDLSDEDCGSVSSISSGPSALDSSNSRKQWLSQGFCSACWNLYKKAKKMKAPIKNKLDNGEWSHCWRKKCSIFYRTVVNLFPFKHVILTCSVCCFVMFITDPNSLTCDQWVLLKKRRPKRVTNITG